MHYKDLYKYSDFKQSCIIEREKLNTKKIQQFLDQGFDINFQNSGSQNSLLLCLICYDFAENYISSEIIEWLIYKGKANVNLQNKEGKTALSLTRDYQTMTTLLKNGAKVNIRDKNDNIIGFFCKNKKNAQLFMHVCLH